MERSAIMRYFKWDHLRDGKLQECSKKFAELAEWMEVNLPTGPEKSAGLRKVLEAKDCGVRSMLPPEPQ